MAPNDATTVTAPPPDQQPTQSTPQTAQRTPPPAAPAAPPQQQAPPPQAVQAKPGQTFHNMSHAFLGSVLGALAGAPPTKYTTDNDPASDTYGRQTVDPKQPTDSVSDRLKRIAQNALMGLAAGSQVDPKKSGAADVLSGVGAGADAVMKQKITQDATSREKETENFKQEQAAKLQHMEIAKGNALTLSTYYANMKQQNDMTPEFAENQSIYDAAKDSPEFSGRVSEMNWDQVQNELKTDPSKPGHAGFEMTHKIMPLGIAPLTGEDGKTILNPDGTPQTYMRFAVINGMENGNIEVSPQLAASAAEYGPMGGIPNAADVKTGQTLTKQQLMPLLNAIGVQRKNVVEGWHQSKLGYGTNDDGTPDYSKPIEINSYDKSRTRPMGGPGVVPAEAAAAESEEGVKAADTKFKNAQAQEQIAAGREHLATAAMLSGSLIGQSGDAIHQAILSDPKIQGAIAAMPLPAQSVIRSLPPINLPGLLSVANGDARLTDVFPARPIKGTGVISSQQAMGVMHLFNPNYNEQMFDDKKKDLESVTTGTQGDAIRSFGNFFNHTAELNQVSKEMQRSNSPLLNKPLNVLKRDYAGNPEVSRLMTAIQAQRSEWETFIHAGHVPSSDEVAYGQKLEDENSSPQMILGVSQVMGDQALGRLDNINEGFKTVWHQDIPNLIPSQVRDSINQIGLGNKISKYNTGGNIPGTPAQPGQNPQSGQISVTDPNGGVHTFADQASADKFRQLAGIK